MELERRIQNYWDTRSNKFFELRIEEFESDKKQRWIDIISDKMPKDKKLKVLDIGTGTGFFAITMESLGHEVMGIDLSPEMIEKANETAKLFNMNAEFKVMNAQKLEFEDCSFDMIITRNLTWTLPDAESAYKEWYRVLKQDGILMNFDADYGKVSFESQVSELDINHAHAKIDVSMMRECDDIKDTLEISKNDRPKWDVKVLNEIGYNDVYVDNEVNKKIYVEQDDFYNPTDMFFIFAKK